MEVNFSACLRHVLAMEGGFVNDLADHGGATNWGITAATLAHWRGHPVTEADVRSLQPVEARTIYHANYWNTVRGAELPSGVDLVVFDISVNSGPRRAVRMLQEALGVIVDGILGPVTLRAVAVAEAGVVIDRLADARRRFYVALTQRDPSQARFLAGWQNRVRATTKAAQVLLRTCPHAAGPTATASSSEAVATTALNSV